MYVCTSIYLYIVFSYYCYFNIVLYTKDHLAKTKDKFLLRTGCFNVNHHEAIIKRMMKITLI